MPRSRRIIQTRAAEALESRCLLSADPVQVGDILWLPDPFRNEMERLDLTTGTWLETIPLKGAQAIPEAFTVHDEYLYLGEVNQLVRYAHDGTGRAVMAEFGESIQFVGVDGDVLLVGEDDKHGITLTSLQQYTGQVLDTYSSHTEGLFWETLTLLPNDNRIVGRSNGRLGARTLSIDYSELGEFSNLSLRRPAVSRQNGSQFHVNPSGTQLMDGAGNFFSIEPLYSQHLAIPADAHHAAFLDDQRVIVSDDAHLYGFTTDGNEVFGSIPLWTAPFSIAASSNSVTAFWRASGQASGYYTERYTMEEFTTLSDGDAVDPQGLAFIPDQVASLSGGRSVLYSAEHAGLFLRIVGESSYSHSFALHDSVQRLSAVPGTGQLHILYTGGLITGIDFDAEEPIEFYVGRTTDVSVGLTATSDAVLQAIPGKLLRFGDGYLAGGSATGVAARVIAPVSSSGKTLADGSVIIHQSRHYDSDLGSYVGPRFARLQFEPNGSFTLTPGETDASDVFRTGPIISSPSGSAFLTSSGTVYDTETLRPSRKTLPLQFEDAIWTDQSLVTLTAWGSGALISQLDPESLDLQHRWLEPVRPAGLVAAADGSIFLLQADGNAPPEWVPIGAARELSALTWPNADVRVISSENGTASVQVRLPEAPSAEVIVEVAVTHPELLSVDTATLTFGPEDWSLPQTVEVTGTRPPGSPFEDITSTLLLSSEDRAIAGLPLLWSPQLADTQSVINSQGIVYRLRADQNTIELLRLSDNTTLSGPDVSGLPGRITQLAAINGAVYLVVGAAVYRLPSDGSRPRFVLNVGHDIDNIIGDGELLFLTFGGERPRIVSATTSGRIIDVTPVTSSSSSADHVRRAGITVFPERRELHFEAGTGNWSAYRRLRYTADGAFGEPQYTGNIKSPTPSADGLQLLDGDSFLLVPNSGIYSTANAELLAGLPQGTVDAGVVNGKHVIATAFASDKWRLTALEKGVLLRESVVLPGEPAGVWQADNLIHVAYPDFDAEGQLTRVSFTLGELGLPPDNAVPDPASSKLDTAFHGTTGQGRFFRVSRKSRLLYMIDATGAYITGMHLSGVPRSVAASDADGSVFVQFTDDRMVRIRTRNEQLIEEPLVEPSGYLVGAVESLSGPALLVRTRPIGSLAGELQVQNLNGDVNATLGTADRRHELAVHSDTILLVNGRRVDKYREQPSGSWEVTDTSREMVTPSSGRGDSEWFRVSADGKFVVHSTRIFSADTLELIAELPDSSNRPVVFGDEDPLVIFNERHDSTRSRAKVLRLQDFTFLAQSEPLQDSNWLALADNRLLPLPIQESEALPLRTQHLLEPEQRGITVAAPESRLLFGAGRTRREFHLALTHAPTNKVVLNLVDPTGRLTFSPHALTWLPGDGTAAQLVAVDAFLPTSSSEISESIRIELDAESEDPAYADAALPSIDYRLRPNDGYEAELPDAVSTAGRLYIPDSADGVIRVLRLGNQGVSEQVVPSPRLFSADAFAAEDDKLYAAGSHFLMEWDFATEKWRSLATSDLSVRELLLTDDYFFLIGRNSWNGTFVQAISRRNPLTVSQPLYIGSYSRQTTPIGPDNALVLLGDQDALGMRSVEVSADGQLSLNTIVDAFPLLLQPQSGTIPSSPDGRVTVTKGGEILDLTSVDNLRYLGMDIDSAIFLQDGRLAAADGKRLTLRDPLTTEYLEHNVTRSVGALADFNDYLLVVYREQEAGAPAYELVALEDFAPPRRATIRSPSQLQYQPEAVYPLPNNQLLTVDYETNNLFVYDRPSGGYTRAAGLIGQAASSAWVPGEEVLWIATDTGELWRYEVGRTGVPGRMIDVLPPGSYYSLVSGAGLIFANTSGRRGGNSVHMYTPEGNMRDTFITQAGIFSPQWADEANALVFPYASYSGRVLSVDRDQQEFGSLSWSRWQSTAGSREQSIVSPDALSIFRGSHAQQYRGFFKPLTTPRTIDEAATEFAFWMDGLYVDVPSGRTHLDVWDVGVFEQTTELVDSVTFPFRPIDVIPWMESQVLIVGQKPGGYPQFSVLPVASAEFAGRPIAIHQPEIQHSLTPELSWHPSEHAVSYEVRLIDSEGIEQHRQFADATSVVVDGGLSRGLWQWQVRSLSADGSASPWSRAQALSIDLLQFDTPDDITFGTVDEIVWSGREDYQSIDLWVSDLNAGALVYSEEGRRSRSWEPEEPLQAGRYAAWLRPRDAEGSPLEWIGPRIIEVRDRQAPGFTMESDIQSSGTMELTWSAHNKADMYEVEVTDSNGRRVYYSSSVTDNQLLVPRNLAGGEYTAWVRGRLGGRPVTVWSEPASVIMTQAPAVTLSSSQLQVRPYPHTAAWKLQVVHRQRGEVVADFSETTQKTLTIDPPLESGYYEIRGTAIYAGGIESDSMTVTQRVYGSPIFVDVPEYSVDQTPVLSWDASPGDPTYRIEIYNRSQNRRVYLRVGEEQRIHQVSRALGNGLYTVWVRAEYPDGGTSRWGNGTHFNIGAPLTVEHNRSRLSWVPVSDASHYEIWIDTIDPQGNRESQFIHHTEYTGVTLDTQSFPTGTYQAWVRAIRVEGNSTYRSFWNPTVEWSVASADSERSGKTPEILLTTAALNAVAIVTTNPILLTNLSTTAVTPERASAHFASATRASNSFRPENPQLSREEHQYPYGTADSPKIPGPQNPAMSGATEHSGASASNNLPTANSRPLDNARVFADITDPLWEQI